MIKKKKGNDIKCDSCGKFVAYTELNENGGASNDFIPDSEYTTEEVRFRCKKCTEKLGSIKIYV